MLWLAILLAFSTALACGGSGRSTSGATILGGPGLPPGGIAGGSPTATVTATSTAPTPTPSPSPSPTLEWIGEIPQSGWSEGLEWHDGRLWHPYPGQIEVVSTADGAVLTSYEPPSDYSESVTWLDGHLYDLSYHTNGIYQGTLAADGSMSWAEVGTTPDVHGWGIATDGHQLFMTGNGQPYVYVLDPADMHLVRTVTTPVDDLEDIAWQNGWIWASSYSEHHGQIFRIDLLTGDILDVWDLPDPENCSTIDGIAVAHDTLWVTGKNCPYIYVAKIGP